jgi:hypothetical protein
MGTAKTHLIRKYVGNNLEILLVWSVILELRLQRKIVALSCSGHDPLCRGLRGGGGRGALS